MYHEGAPNIRVKRWAGRILPQLAEIWQMLNWQCVRCGVRKTERVEVCDVEM